MQQMQLVQSKLGEFIGAFQKLLLAADRQTVIRAIKAELEPVISDALGAFSRKSTDAQRYLGAAIIFDMCLNVPDRRHQQRIQQQLIGEMATGCTQAFSLLQQAYDKLEAFQFGSGRFDPVLEALFAAVMVSSLENEDAEDPEMQNLFATYSDSYMLVSTNSCIIEDIIVFQ